MSPPAHPLPLLIRSAYPCPPPQKVTQETTLPQGGPLGTCVSHPSGQALQRPRPSPARSGLTLLPELLQVELGQAQLLLLGRLLQLLLLLLLRPPGSEAEGGGWVRGAPPTPLALGLAAHPARHRPHPLPATGSAYTIREQEVTGQRPTQGLTARKQTQPRGRCDSLTLQGQEGSTGPRKAGHM